MASKILTKVAFDLNGMNTKVAVLKHVSLFKNSSVSCGGHSLFCSWKGEKGEPQVKKPRVKSYAVEKFMGFVDRYMVKFESRFEKISPKAYRIYKLFKDGVRDFYQDSKSYYRVASGLWYKEQSLSSFSYQDLENYRQIPSDMARVAPVLLISLLPFANYVIFPIAYMFPRQLLCRHFWTDEQKSEINVYYLKQRLLHYPKIYTFLVKESDNVKDVGLRKVFQKILWKVEQGSPVEVEEILDCRPLFEDQLSFNRLYRRHRVYMQWHVARSWNFPGRKPWMIENARLLHRIDMALNKIGVDSLSLPQLHQACFYRGLNASGVSEEDQRKFLSIWTEISEQITEPNLSLLVHAPVLLTFSHRSNAKYLLKDIDLTKGVLKP